VLHLKSRLSLLSLTFSTLLGFSAVSTSQGEIITFDDIADAGDGIAITNGYHGYLWSQFGVLNATNSSNGYFTGMVSTPNVAYNNFTNPTEIDSVGTNFNFLSVYLTAAWTSNMNVRVQGFSGAQQLYDQTVVVSWPVQTQFAFNYQNINRLTFTTSGGVYAGFGTVGPWFAMDNLNIVPVPEPSAILLTGAGVLGLLAFHRRNQRP